MNIATLLELPSALFPDHVAVVDGEHEVTYGQLQARAHTSAAFLAESGIGPGDVVGYLGRNHVEFVTGLFGTATLGACLAALNYRSGLDELRYLLADSSTRIVLVEASCSTPEIVQLTGELGIRIVLLSELTDIEILAGRSAPPALQTSDSDPALLIYTSGTSARPKGVPLSHGALTDYVLARTDVGDGTDVSRTLLSVPLFHIAGVSGLLAALYGGRTTVLEPRFEAREWLRLVARHRVTHAFLVPTMLAQIIDTAEFAMTDLSSLVSIAYGAAPMPPALLRRIIAAFPVSVAFSGAYGLSETTSTVAVLDEDDHRRIAASANDTDRRLVFSAGQPVNGVRIEILDSDAHRLGPDVVGEIAVTSRRNIARYWHGSSAVDTAPSGSEESCLLTGDMGYLDKYGYLFITGRKSDMIIRGGENVSPLEVESAILADTRVSDCAVVGLADETWGEVVAAYVVLRDPGQPFGLADARAACGRLSSFKRPEQLFVRNELPRTATGKLLRRALNDSLSSK